MKLSEPDMKPTYNYFWQNLLLAAIGLTFVYLVINVLISWQWIDRPFAGFLHQNRVVTHSYLPDREVRETMEETAPIEEGDVILAADNHPLSSSQWLIEYVRQASTGYSVHYSLLKNGDVVQTTVAIDQFTSQDFTQLVAVPTFMAFITLIAVGAIVYQRSNLLQVKLFALFTLALVYFLASFPDFIVNKLFVLNFVVAFTGKITMPVFLLHFLLLFPHPRKKLTDWPFLLPLIYFPIVPMLTHILVLFIQPETTQISNAVINVYTAIYGTAGLILLVDAIIRTENGQIRKQAFVLLAGLALPALPLLSLIWTPFSTEYNLIYKVLERYGFIGIPIAVAIAVIRYELFDIQRTNLTRFFYMGVIIVALLGYLFLFVLINPISINIDPSYFQDAIVILLTIVAFFSLRPLYRETRDWIRQRAYGSIEDFRMGLRIFSHQLLEARSRRDLETLISWEVASDFRLRSAELGSTGKPTTPYAIQLPLRVSNTSLGTLFLGAKINGKIFTQEELEILTEMQKQLSLALWSLELDKAIQATEQLTRLKSKFLANVTHELRAPLNGIINYVGLVFDDYKNSLNQEQTDHLRQALHSAEELLEIINNILDMSKIEVGQMTLTRQSINLADIVTETSCLVDEMINGKPVEFVTEISPLLPNLYGDRLRLRQIFLNMLSNAIKFTRAGIIRLSVYPDNGNIVIQVADTGIGIDKEILPKIFEHFVSEGLTDAGQHTGPGLSMPITKSLVELHGGQVDVKSHPGQGTTFTVTLPVKPDEQNQEDTLS